jgi:hypothetical protein
MLKHGIGMIHLLEGADFSQTFGNQKPVAPFDFEDSVGTEAKLMIKAVYFLEGRLS